MLLGTALLVAPGVALADGGCVLNDCGGGSVQLHDGSSGQWQIKASMQGSDVQFSGTQDGHGGNGGSRAPVDGTTTIVGPPPCVVGPVHVQGNIPLPTIDIQTSPSTGGVVAVPTWFWVAGYHGGHIRQPGPGTQHVCNPPRDIIVTLYFEIWPVGYSWNFGDGHSYAHTCPGSTQPADCPSGLGLPDTDTISHSYEASSYRFGDDGGYPVTLTVSYDAQVTDQNGNRLAYFHIPDLTYPRTLGVREIQSVLVHN